MATHLREAIHDAADRLLENRLAEVLDWMQRLIDAGDNPDVEPERWWTKLKTRPRRLTIGESI